MPLDPDVSEFRDSHIFEPFVIERVLQNAVSTHAPVALATPGCHVNRAGVRPQSEQVSSSCARQFSPKDLVDVEPPVPYSNANDR